MEVIELIHTVIRGETLSQISSDYRISLSAIINANPELIGYRIYPGQSINIPEYPTPDTIPFQIDVSVSNRLLRLFKHGVLEKQYPIAVGKKHHRTPTGNFIIINKAPNPDGVFGTMWMSISKEHYGIHGTNNPSSIGKAISMGCIRMFNHDAEELASIIPIGTSVTILP